MVWQFLLWSAAKKDVETADQNAGTDTLAFSS
jgi:hypothetical protein